MKSRAHENRYTKTYPRRYKDGRRVGSNRPTHAHQRRLTEAECAERRTGKRWAAWCAQNARDLHRLLATPIHIMGRVGHRWFGRRDSKTGEPILPTWAKR